jgi:enolase-phosphatase E1
MVIKAIVLDIEGTICPISFVKEVLFPYSIDSIRKLVNGLPDGEFPLSESTSDDLKGYLQKFPSEFKASKQVLLDHIQDLVVHDVKAPYWKSLQGYLWREGYESGQIQAPLYSDAIEFITKSANIVESGVYIYSSGSVAAQKLLFKYCKDIKGGPTLDLTSVLSGYFDTINAGPKTEKSSYDTIQRQLKNSPAQNTILFLSDNPTEIVAAKQAGWQTIVALRPGNAPIVDDQLLDDVTKTTDFSNIII